ncbi:tetratricopeptide repeat protein [Actinokineospora auranticolor]|uniref:Putative thioredoxin n=1 Tax=Actinokineospora auranticolor TaxID=155976 RepID=A0A2S6GBC2_9PSEU|nr:tetratricopeptide repeat protein [Actinokineospora auranticolor]PPK61108.1 putative thioredoxin [Actinokineospora auranticolor]
MTRPDPRQTAALSAALSRAVDLSALKARADAAARAPKPATPASDQDDTDAPATSGAHSIDVTEANFEAEVVERSAEVPVVVALVAGWSAQSKQLVGVLERLAVEGRGAWRLAKVDVEISPRVAQLFGVQAVPMVIAIAARQPVDAFNDVPPEDRVRQWINSILDALRDRLPGIRAAEAGAPAAVAEPEPEDERFAAAEDAFEAGDFETAEARYQAILDAEPANADAKAALAQVRFLARTQAIDPSVIVRADTSPDDVDAQAGAADLELAGQQVEKAFGRLIAAVRRSSGAERDKARTHLVSLFDLFPADDPRVVKARRELASALF